MRINMPAENPKLEEVIKALELLNEQNRRKPWYEGYDEQNYYPFAWILEIGLREYGEWFKDHFTTQSRDFSVNPEPFEDRNIAIGCITATTLAGHIGTMTHILDRADPQGAVRYLRSLHRDGSNIPLILSGGRDRISENLRNVLLSQLPDKGFVIKGTELMGTAYGRIAILEGTNNRVRILRTHNRTKITEELFRNF